MNGNRVKRWLPVLLWMAGIYYFSSRHDPLGFLPSSETRSSWAKVAHFTEYAGLYILLHRALTRPRKLSQLFTPALIALAYAIFDELHQALVPGRFFELSDISCDATGIVVAMGIIWGRKTIDRRVLGRN